MKALAVLVALAGATHAATPVDAVPLPPGATKRLGGTSFRQAGKLTALASSADGKWIAATAGDDLAVWSALTGKLVYSDPGNMRTRASAIAFVGDRLVVGHGSGQIAVLSTTDWREQRTLAPCVDEWVSGVAASPDGKTLAFTCGAAIRLQPIEGGSFKSIGTFDGNYGPIAWSGDGAWIALTTVRDNQLHIIEVATGRETTAPKFKKMQPIALAFSPQGAVLAYDDRNTYGDDKVVLYDVSAKKPLGAYRVEVGADAIAFSRDGKHLALAQAAGKHALVLIDLPTGKRRELVQPAVSIAALSFADPVGAQLWIGHDNGVRLWDIADDRQVFGANGHLGGIKTLAYRPDGKVLASGGSDGTIRVWDLAMGSSQLLEGESSGATALGWARDGSTLYAADGALTSWNASTLHRIRETALQDMSVTGFALSSDAKTVFSVGKELEADEVTLWVSDAETGKQRSRIPKFDGERIAISHDGKMLAVSNDDYVRILDATTAAEIGRIKIDRGEELGFSPDDMKLAIGTHGGVKVYAVASRGQIAGDNSGDWIRAIAWTNDGRLIAGTHDGELSVASKRYTTSFRGDIYAIAVAPDGKSFAIAGEDGQILIYPLSSRP